MVTDGVNRSLCRFASGLIPQPANGRLRRCSHPEVGGLVTRIDDCSKCSHWTTKDGTEEPELKRIPLPCLNAGRPVPPPEGKSPLRTYFACDAGYGVRCKCQCGAECPDFTPDGGVE